MSRAVDNVRRYRMELAQALVEWRDAGGPVEEITDLIEGLISAKLDAVLQAREDIRELTSTSRMEKP